MSLSRPTATFDPNQTHLLLELTPTIAPAGTTVIFSIDSRLRYGRIINNTAATIVVSVKDRQITPIALCPTVPLGPGGVILMTPEDDGDVCYGGMTIETSDDGLEIYFRGTPL